MTDARGIPSGIDITVPNSARMHDYYLGGKDNFRADRDAAEKIMAIGPSREVCRANRRFLGRAVRYTAQHGVRQFLDLGTGLPNMNNVHEVARQVHPDSHVVYVDYDPVVTAHARALLPHDGLTAVVQADVREPEKILGHPNVERLIDFTRPVGVVFLGILHCLTDEEDPWGTVSDFRERMAPGSYVIISHPTDDAHPEVGDAARDVYQDASVPLVFRSHADISRLFTGFNLVEPGVTKVSDWRPEQETHEIGSEWCYAGVGRKPDQAQL